MVFLRSVTFFFVCFWRLMKPIICACNFILYCLLLQQLDLHGLRWWQQAGGQQCWQAENQMCKERFLMLLPENQMCRESFLMLLPENQMCKESFLMLLPENQMCKESFLMLLPENQMCKESFLMLLPENQMCKESFLMLLPVRI